MTRYNSNLPVTAVLFHLKAKPFFVAGNTMHND